MIYRRTRRPPRARGRRMLFLPLLALLFPAAACGDEPSSIVLNGESKAAASRMEEARKRIGQRQWSEAIEALQAIVNGASEDLIPLASGHSIRAARLGQLQLASLPPEALRLYRQRYEAQAGKKLERALADSDAQLLRAIAEESFVTRAAEKAIDRLGDLAFERGRFVEAEEWWRLLAPFPSGGEPAKGAGSLVYPDGSLDPARLWAKQMVARLFRGFGPEWRHDLDAFRSRYGRAEGVLAGRKGRYADVLQTLAEERAKEGAASEIDWLTFAGSPQRGRRLAAPEDVLDRLSALLREGPTWRFNLEERQRQEEAPPPPAGNASQARSLAFYPVIVGHQVLAADARYVTAYDATSGQSRQWYDGGEINDGKKTNLKLPAPPDLRYTLTVVGERVYARLGTQDVGIPAPPSARAARFGQAPQPRRENETFLACLEVKPNGMGEHFRWSIRGRSRGEAFFEGAPLATEERIWIACSRYHNGRCITAIDCYAADGASEPPLRWRRDVCETPEPKAGEIRTRHPLLTRAGTQLVYCTHTGVILAVDAESGRTNWAIRYPRRAVDTTDQKTWKDLVPPLFAAGRVYVAPADSDRLLCLDPLTGQTLWEREAMKVVHLLGVGQGRLIFTTSHGLRAVGAANGLDEAGWMVPQSGGSLPSAGRGLLIGDLVLWPTVRKRDDLSSSMQTVVYAVRQSDGQPAGDPAMLHRLPAGNLAYANGILTVTDRHTLYVFTPPRLLMPARKAEARRQPGSIFARLALGRAEADAGLMSQALETLRQAEALALDSPGSTQQRHLLVEVRTEQQRILLEAARGAAINKRWQTASSAIAQAVGVPLSARARLHALLRAAQIWKENGQSVRARAAWEAILADKELRSIQVLDKNNTPQSAADSARAHLRREDASPQRKQGTPLLALRANSSWPLFRAWHATLGNDEWVLAGWRAMDPDLLVTGGSEGRLFCRGTSDGAIRWRQELPFVPRWAGSHADAIVACGDRGVAALRRSDGELLWHFPAPAPGSYPTSPVDDVRVILAPQTPESLTAFRLVSGRLFFLQGQRRLFALDAETGRVLWNDWASDGGFRFPYPRGCFSAHYHAGAQTVLMQMSGKRWLLDATTGRLLQRMTDSRDLWPRPPLPLDERALCVIADKRQIVLLDALTGRPRWSHALRGGTTLSGEAPLVLGRGDVLLLVTPANIGYFLQRLDRGSGKPLWPQPRLLSMKALDAAAFALDEEAIYWVEDPTLCARSLTDGRSLWRHSLHGANAWQIQRVGDYVIVHPVPSVEAGRFRFRSVLGSVQWQIGALLAPEVVFAVSCLDAKTGQLVQRWNFRLAAPARTTCETRTTLQDRGRSLLLRTSPLLASADGPAVRLASPRPFIAVGGEVWGLTPMMNEE